MKNLKISLTAIIVAMILMVSTVVLAYDGVVVNTNDNLITMPSNLSNGEGTISTGIEGSTYFQFVQITDSQYNKIKQLKEKLQVITYYRAWEKDCDEVAGEIVNENNANYLKFKELKEKYNTNYPDDAFGDGLEYTEAKLDETSNKLTTAYVDFVEANWTETTGNKVSIDLSTFKGTQKYLLWTKLVSSANPTVPVYNANIYVLTGTKKDEPKPENNTIANNTVVNNTVLNNTIENNTVKNTTPNTTKNEAPQDNTTKVKKDNTTTTKSIPYTGVGSAILGLIGLAGGAAGVSYRKYSKIK